MNRIPTEGLKLHYLKPAHLRHRRLNEQNPDRGIETNCDLVRSLWLLSLNEQNPDRGIETLGLFEVHCQNPGLNEQNPDRGIETYEGEHGFRSLGMLE